MLLKFLLPLLLVAFSSAFSISNLFNGNAVDSAAQLAKEPVEGEVEELNAVNQEDDDDVDDSDDEEDNDEEDDDNEDDDDVDDSDDEQDNDEEDDDNEDADENKFEDGD